MKPIVIDDNFLTRDEIEDIKTKVFMLKDHWEPLLPPDNPLLYAGMLPGAMYSKFILEQDVMSINKIMSIHFSYYYDKIKNKLSEYYSMPIDYTSKLQLPGFHIFHSYGNKEIESNVIRYHTDIFEHLKRFVPEGTIESVIIPISLPISGGALLWSNSEYRQNPINRYSPQQDCDNVFAYSEGTMALWPGKLPHAIAPFTLLNSSEYRITFQFHVNRLPDHGIIFW